MKKPIRLDFDPIGGYHITTSDNFILFKIPFTTVRASYTKETPEYLARGGAARRWAHLLFWFVRFLPFRLLIGYTPSKDQP